MSLFYLKHRRALALGPPKLSHINGIPRSLVQVAQIPESLDFPSHKLPDHFHYTGPWLQQPAEQTSDFPWDRLNGRPLVYASLGTLQNRVARWHDIIVEPCSGLDVQLVVGLGRASADAVELQSRFSKHAIVARFAPQRTLLARSSVAIIHASLNSALETLSAGAPVVAIPIGHDQPGVAARLRRAGVGCFIKATDLEAGTLRAAVSGVLANPSFRQRAGASSARLREIDGPALAAELIERAFVSRQRVRLR